MGEQVAMTEAMALVDKKVNMALDDLIKMSRTNAKKPNKRRVSNRHGKFVNNVTQDKSSKVRRYMDSRSSLRQGALAQRRSNFQGNQFPLASETARKSASAPIRGKHFNRSRQFIVNEQRVGAPAFQRKAASGGGFTVKRPLPQVNVAPEHKPKKTLDSRFANMKEQRMRVFPQQNNNGSRMRVFPQQNNNGSRRRNGSGPTIVPWARNRF